MKAAFYIGTRKPWYVGLGNRLTRLRLRSQISHCELVFEPGDGVDALMPTDAGDATWCAGSSASDAMPAWSPRRVGKHGGVRFKRINVADRSKWLLVELPGFDAGLAARWMSEHQGAMYDWQGILGFVAWPIPQKSSRWSCHEALAAALGLPLRTDPAALCEWLIAVGRRKAP